MTKRAVFAIESLIIFIAMILVATLASGVYISTAGKLQQEALVVGSESKARVANGVDVMRVQAVTQNQHVVGLEFLVRLQASSDMLDLNNVMMRIHTPDKTINPTLQSTRHPTYINYSITEFIDNGPINYPLVPIHIELVENYQLNDEALLVTIHTTTIPVVLGDFSSDDIIDIEALPLQHNNVIYGFLTLQGDLSLLDAATGQQYAQNGFYCEDMFTRCTIESEVDVYTYVQPDIRFGIVQSTRNTNHILEDREVVTLYVPFSEPVFEGDTIEVTFLGKNIFTYTLSFAIPNVLTHAKEQVWP
ncbi:MAG: hypothetical protein ACMXYC_04255 [Candidatus Woesearchaeota archaeon]